MNKHKSRQHSRNAAHYKAQYIKTYRNKLRRVFQSSGLKAAAAYQAHFYPTALAKSTEKARAA